jgi:sulfoxide reductase heme-binding subunit YedZ
MSAAKDPTVYLWWLVSRASGIVALGLITSTVLLGLTMSAKVLRRPGLGRTLVKLHEHLALVSLGAISLHGLALLGDPWLHPGVGGITIPFAMAYRPLATGVGMIGGYLAALLGLSYYVRRRIGVRLWRRLHRATILVWVLGVVHTLGAGSDAATIWLRAYVLLPAVPIVYLFVLRMLGQGRPQARRPGSAADRASQSRGGLSAPEPARHPRQGVARGAAVLAEEQA